MLGRRKRLPVVDENLRRWEMGLKKLRDSDKL